MPQIPAVFGMTASSLPLWAGDTLRHAPSSRGKLDRMSEVGANPAALGDEELRRARRLLARRELPLGRADLPARQPAAPRAAAREHVKPRLLGHFGTTPGLNLVYAHLNRAIRARELDAIFVTGPGHGGPGIVANA